MGGRLNHVLRNWTLPSRYRWQAQLLICTLDVAGARRNWALDFSSPNWIGPGSSGCWDQLDLGIWLGPNLVKGPVNIFDLFYFLCFSSFPLFRPSPTSFFYFPARLVAFLVFFSSLLSFSFILTCISLFRSCPALSQFLLSISLLPSSSSFLLPPCSLFFPQLLPFFILQFIFCIFSWFLELAATASWWGGDRVWA